MFVIVPLKEFPSFGKRVSLLSRSSCLSLAVFLPSGLLVSSPALAAVSGDTLFQRQSEQQDALQQRLTASPPDVRLSPSVLLILVSLLEILSIEILAYLCLRQKESFITVKMVLI